MRSTACSSWDAQATPARPNPERDWDQCACTPDPCTTLADVITWLCGDADVRGENAVFSQMGRKLLICLLTDMLWNPVIPRAEKTLRALRARVTIPNKDMRGFLEQIADDSHSAVARDYARTLMGIHQRTFDGAYVHATTETDALAYEDFAGMLSRPDFDPSDICNGQTTVFISVSMADLQSHPALGRVLVGAFQSSLRRAEGKVNRRRVLFLLDEARFLGKLPTLANMMTADRKYGATIVTMWQSWTDLKAIWKADAGVFTSNSSWTMYAAIEDDETEKLISGRAGKFTIIAKTNGRSTNSGSGSQGSGTHGTNVGQSEQGRDLIRPDEVRTMRTDEAIIFYRGSAPIRCGRAVYFRRPELRERIDADRLRAAATPDPQTMENTP